MRRAGALAWATVGVAAVAMSVGVWARGAQPADGQPGAGVEASRPVRAPEPAGAGSGPVIRSPRTIEAWTAPLSLLDPERPEGYFLLAEEVMAEWPDREGRLLARTLLVLAVHLEQARPGPPPPGRAPISGSACLALASLEAREDVQRWLAAMANLLDAGVSAPGSPGGKRPPRTIEPVNWRTALEAAEVLQWARAGEGRRASQLLERPGVRDVLEDFEAGLDTERRLAGLSRVLKSIADWPGGCERCRSTRFVSTPAPRGTRGPGTLSLCDRCNGLPGPVQSPSELLADLRLESMLLRGVHRSWSAQLLVDAGRPVLEPEPSALARAYLVEVDKPVWRQGKWVER